MQFFITCPKGLEALLEDELKGFGAQRLKQTQAGVEVEAELEFAYRTCLWSRLANRVLLLLGQVDATSADQLYDGVKAISWLQHLRSGGTLTVDFNGKNPAINNTHFGALKVKDAIVDSVREQTGSRPSVDKRRPDLRVNVHLRRDKAQIAIDLSGESLHRRGYRQQTGAAPMKENLAAALLIRAGWGTENAPNVLVDPMCGSGTLLTEAVMISADIAPGLLRKSYGFDRWLQNQPTTWNALRAEAVERREQGLQRLNARFYGFDADAKVLESAADNTEVLGLSDAIQFNRADLSMVRNPLKSDEDSSGLLITNPPYGERLGEVSTLRFLYKELGDLLKREFAGWKAGIFTSNPDLCKLTGLKADKIYRLFNGPLASQLLLFTVYQRVETQPEEVSESDTDEASIVANTGDGYQSEGAQMLENRLRKNVKALSRWVKREGVQAYRAYDADIPEYAVAIDCYADQFVIQEYAPPANVDSVKAFKRLQDAINVVARVFEVGTDAITLKQRKRQQGTSQYQRQSDQGQTHRINEYGCDLEVNLRDFLDTGLFLDHRPVRKLIQQSAKGARYLNLFCYTATASVHAARGGARSTTSVDMSATYLDWAKRNFALNGFTGKEHQFIQEDCIRWLERPKSDRFDLIFMDPPTFSNSKRMSDVLDVQRDHQKLIRGAMSLLSPEGKLIFSNNYRRFKIDAELYETFEIKDITAQTIDPDFKRNPRIHSCFLIQHKSS